MAFENFKKRVMSIIDMTNEKSPPGKGEIKVRFHEDKEGGKFYANISDGTRIVGNSTSAKLTYIWGSGHMATA